MILIYHPDFTHIIFFCRSDSVVPETETEYKTRATAIIVTQPTYFETVKIINKKN